MDYPTDPQHYELVNKVGGGVYSDVYEAVCLDNKITVCAKIINLDEFPGEIDDLLKQLNFWSSCSSPNIVKYHCSFLNGNKVWIITEFMDGGSIEDILKFAFKSGIKDESILANVLCGALKALKYFHDQQKIHRNVKSCNILVNTRGDVKLADFGLATSFIEGGVRKEACLSMYGDACYMSPEVLEKIDGYTFKSDVWSLGLSAIEMATGKMPFEGMKMMESIIAVINKAPIKLPKRGFSAEFNDFVDKCLVHSQEQRSSSTELLEHKFIKNNLKSGKLNTKRMMESMPSLSKRYQIMHRNDTEKEEKQANSMNFSFDFDLDEGKQQKAEEKIPEKAAEEETKKVEEVQKADNETPEKPKESGSLQNISEGKVGRFKFTVQRHSPENNTSDSGNESHVKVGGNAPRGYASSFAKIPNSEDNDKSKRVAELNAKIDSLTATIDNLEKDHSALIERLEKVKADINSLKKSVK